MLPVTPPITLYTGADGKPLEGGFIHIGQPGQSPAENPATAYWDAAGTIPAAQPLRTVGGYIVNNGAPANVFVAGNHSIAVRDRNNVQVLFDLNRQGNPQGFLTGISGPQVLTALGYTPVNADLAEMRGYVQFRTGPINFASGTAAPIIFSAPGADNGSILRHEISGQYGLHVGIAPDFAYKVGGYSQGTNVFRLTSDASGNLTALGNVTAYSDMRFKEEIEPIADSVARTLQMQGFRYLDNRDGQYKIGTGAQQAQRAGFGEAVVTDDNGHLSLAYGQLALALLIENTRAFHERIAVLEATIHEMKGQ